MLDEILVLCKTYKLAFLDTFCSYSFKSYLIAKKQLRLVKKVLMIMTKCANCPSKLVFFYCLLIKYLWRNQQDIKPKVQCWAVMSLPCKCEQVCNRWVSVVEFHDPSLGIGKVFGQDSTVVKWNYQILSLHLVTVCQKVPILDFQSDFSVSKIIRIFLKKIHWRISI